MWFAAFGGLGWECVLMQREGDVLGSLIRAFEISCCMLVLAGICMRLRWSR